MPDPTIQPVLDYVSEYVATTKEERSAMVERIRFSNYAKNHFIQRQGEIPKQIAFILKGAVRMYYIDESGTEQNTGFTFENHPIVALDSFTQQIPLSINIVALEPTKLIWTTYQEFTEFLEIFPRYREVLLRFLSKVMAMEGEQAKLLRIKSSRDRYEALCEMRPDVIKRVPVKHIASYLHMADETLSRVRAGDL